MKVVSDDAWGALNIYAEARGESFLGQVAVGNTVRERMRLRYFSDGTVVGTIWRPKQFSWTLAQDAQRYKVLQVDDEDPHWIRAVQAWQKSAEHQAVPAGTVLYHADYVTPHWASSPKVQLVDTIGRHLFYQLVKEG